MLVVEHNVEVFKSADWLIDLGLTGGMEGGHLWIRVLWKASKK